MVLSFAVVRQKALRISNQFLYELFGCRPVTIFFPATDKNRHGPGHVQEADNKEVGLPNKRGKAV